MNATPDSYLVDNYSYLVDNYSSSDFRPKVAEILVFLLRPSGGIHT